MASAVQGPIGLTTPQRAAHAAPRAGTPSARGTPAHHTHLASSLAANAAAASASHVAAATASHAASSTGACGGVASSQQQQQLVSELVKKVASFRRGLVHERKERRLLELSLEEAVLQQAHLTSLMREQDVQLMTSLELSASLEHALHTAGDAGEALAAPPITPAALASVFAKPRPQMETELTQLFGALADVQQAYHALEKRAVSERVTAESTNLRLTRELTSVREQLERSQKEARKYRAKCQEVVNEANEAREESIRRRTEAEATESYLRAQLATLQRDTNEKTRRVIALESERSETTRANHALATRATALSDKVDALELTVRRFTCTRVRAHANNVMCEISIRKVPLTGDMILCVRDIDTQDDMRDRTNPHSTANTNTTTTTTTTSATTANQHARLGNHQLFNADGVGVGVASAFVHEYSQDLSTVRCCALDEAGADDAANPSPDDDQLLPPATVLATGASSLLGFRPRFVLCFSGDNHRCLVFETERREFRRTICETLQQFVRMITDKYVDEIGGFFGDASKQS